MDIKFRIHEWLAEHVKGIQYPMPRARLIRQPEPPISMSFGTWLILLIAGCGAIIAGTLILAFMLFIALPAFLD